MRKKSLLLLGLVIMLVAVPSVMALDANPLTEILDIIKDIIEYPITLPHPLDYDAEPVPIWAAVAVFILFYATFLSVARKHLDIFKHEDGTLSGAGKAFAVALSLLIIFASPVVEWIVWLLHTYTLVGFLLLFAWLGYALIGLFFGAWSGVSAGRAKTSKVRGESAKERLEGKKMREDVKIEEGAMGRETGAFKKLKALTKKEFKDAKKLTEYLEKLKEHLVPHEYIDNSNPKKKQIKESLLRVISYIIPLVEEEEKVENEKTKLENYLISLEKVDGVMANNEQALSAKIVAGAHAAGLRHGGNIAKIKNEVMRIKANHKKILAYIKELSELNKETETISGELFILIEKVRQLIYEGTFPQAMDVLSQAIILSKKEREYLNKFITIATEANMIEKNTYKLSLKEKAYLKTLKLK